MSRAARVCCNGTLWAATELEPTTYALLEAKRARSPRNAMPEVLERWRAQDKMKTR